MSSFPSFWLRERKLPHGAYKRIQRDGPGRDQEDEGSREKSLYGAKPYACTAPIELPPTPWKMSIYGFHQQMLMVGH
jgi:hypothetical protein